MKCQIKIKTTKNNLYFLRVDTWKAFETVLFITNVQTKWSDFFRATVATVTSSSIITENPIGNETAALRKHVKETVALQPYGFRDVLTTFPNRKYLKMFITSWNLASHFLNFSVYYKKRHEYKTNST